MVVLDVNSLHQEIVVAEALAQYPVETMLPMSDEDEERLGERCLDEARAALEEAYAASPPDTVEIRRLLDGAAEQYLEKRTVGAKGKPGGKGRGTAPRVKKEPLFQEAKADVLGENDIEALQLRKQRARAADFYFHMRRAPVWVTEEVEESGTGVEEERSGNSVRYILRSWKQCGCQRCCNNASPSIPDCSNLERRRAEAARRPYDAFILKGRMHLGPESGRAPKMEAYWDPEAAMPMPLCSPAAPQRHPAGGVQCSSPGAEPEDQEGSGPSPRPGRPAHQEELRCGEGLAIPASNTAPETRRDVHRQ